jgi:virginiamycin B lyase
MPLRRLIAALAILFSLVFAAAAHAYVYWGDPTAGTIGRANLDGTGATDAFIQTGGKPIGVAVNAAHIYWANESGGTIGRANIEGGEVEPNFITGIKSPYGVAVSPTAIFWPSLTGNEIGKANLDGSGKTLAFVTGVTDPCSIAIDGGHVYWGGGATPAFVGRATLAGKSPEPEWANVGNDVPCGVAVNSANVFVAEFGFLGSGHEIGRVGINGGAFQPSLIGEADGPCGLTIAGSKLYWANAGTATIGVANTDGTSQDEELIQTGGGQICGVAVDSLVSPLAPPVSPPAPVTSSPPPSPPTRGTIRLIKVKDEPQHGTARISVAVDQAGAVSMTGKGIAAAKATAHGAGTVTLTVKALTAKRAALKEAGRLATKLAIVFKPSDGGASASLAKALTLREHSAHK